MSQDKPEREKPAPSNPPPSQPAPAPKPLDPQDDPNNPGIPIGTGKKP
jgi:hypothetical protein